MLQGARPGRIFGKEILCACGLTRTSIDYVRKLSGHSLVPRVRLECNQHQDCAKARPTDFGEHGGKPKGDVAAMQTFSMGRLYVGGFLLVTLMRVRRKEHASMSSSSQVVPSTPDILVCNEGTVFLFCPLTNQAKAWIDDHVQSDAQWFGNTLVVEHRFAWGLAQGMKNAGLVLA